MKKLFTFLKRKNHLEFRSLNFPVLFFIIGMIFLSGRLMGQAPGTVEIYDNDNFQGENDLYQISGDGDIKKVAELGKMNDRVASLRVGKGVKVTCYKDPGFSGMEVIFYEGAYTTVLVDWADEFSSIKIEKVDPDLPLITLWTEKNQSGKFQKVGLTKKDEFKKEWNLLLDNGLSSISIPDEYSVTLYEHSDYGGHHNSEPLDPGNHNFDTYNLDDEVSSIKIEWREYELTNIEIIDEREIKAHDEVVAATTICINESQGHFTCVAEFEEKYGAEYTTSFENSSMVGITNTTTISATVGGDAVGGSVTLERSIAVEVANTFSFGKSETKTKEQGISASASLLLPEPGQKAKFTLLVTPVEMEYDVKYTYTPKDGQGKPKIVEGLIKVKRATKTIARAQQIGEDGEVITNNGSSTPSNNGGNAGNTNSGNTNSGNANNSNSGFNTTVPSDPNIVNISIYAPPGKVVRFEGSMIIHDAGSDINLTNSSTTSNNTNNNNTTSTNPTPVNVSNPAPVQKKTKVEKADPSQNIALGKQTRQSSDFNNSYAAAFNAVDGNTNGEFRMDPTNTITHTNNGTNPWWEIDLGAVYDISEIKIWNRTDGCCWNWMTKFYVMVSDEPIDEVSTTEHQYANRHFSFTSQGEKFKSINGNKTGRYVRIFIEGDNKALTLTEVEIFAR